MDLIDRLKGCLVGGAIGDCLGAPHEGAGPLGAVTPPTSWAATDDTQLTLATGRAIAERGRVDPEAIAGALAAEFQQGRLTGLGASTRKALGELAAGAHWALVGRRGEMAAGNGAAARIAPVAFCLDLRSSLHRTLLRDVCRITHHSEEAYAGALAVALAVRLAIQPSTDEPWPLLARVASRLPDSVTRDRLIELAALPDDATIGEAGARFGTSGYAAESVPLALFASRQIETRSLGVLLEDVIRAGGDTDTNAAIAGQIAGAHLGHAGLPPELVRQVPGLDQIIEVAQRIGPAARP